MNETLHERPPVKEKKIRIRLNTLAVPPERKSLRKFLLDTVIMLAIFGIPGGVFIHLSHMQIYWDLTDHGVETRGVVRRCLHGDPDYAAFTLLISYTTADGREYQDTFPVSYETFKCYSRRLSGGTISMLYLPEDPECAAPADDMQQSMTAYVSGWAIIGIGILIVLWSVMRRVFPKPASAVNSKWIGYIPKP